LPDLSPVIGDLRLNQMSLEVQAAVWVKLKSNSVALLEEFLSSISVLQIDSDTHTNKHVGHISEECWCYSLKMLPQRKFTHFIFSMKL
jgi:hypothetical protein